MAEYGDLQADTSQRLVKLATYAKLGSRLYNENANDVHALGDAIQSRSKLAHFTAEYLAVEAQKSTDDRVSSLEPELHAKLKEIGGLLETAIPAGPESVDRRRDVLRAAVLKASEPDEEIDPTTAAGDLNAAAGIKVPARHTRLNPMPEKKFEAETAGSLITELRALRENLNKRAKDPKASLFANSELDSIDRISGQEDTTNEMTRLDGEMRQGASDEQLAALNRHYSAHVDEIEEFRNNTTYPRQLGDYEIARLLGHAPARTVANGVYLGPTPTPEPEPAGSRASRSQSVSSMRSRVPETPHEQATRDPTPVQSGPGGLTGGQRAASMNWNHERQPGWDELEHMQTSAGLPDYRPSRSPEQHEREGVHPTEAGPSATVAQSAQVAPSKRPRSDSIDADGDMEPPAQRRRLNDRPRSSEASRT